MGVKLEHMKTLRMYLLGVSAALLLSSCAQSVTNPSPDGYAGAFSPFLATPMAGPLRTEESNLALRFGPEGAGFQVTGGAFALELYARNGVFLRGSYAESGFFASVGATYETYETYGGPPDFTALSIANAGVGADLGYTWPIELRGGGMGYFGPRVYGYYGCVAEGNDPFVCDQMGVIPGFMVGVNVPVFDNLRFSVELAALALFPDANNPRFRFSSPLNVTLSYRF